MKPIKTFHVIVALYVHLVSAIEVPASATQKKASQPSAFSSVGEKVGDAFEDAFEVIEDTIEHYSAFAGKIFPVLSKLYISPEKARNIIAAIRKVQEPGDWIFIILIGWATIPAIRYPYEKFSPGKKKDEARQFEGTFTYYFAEHVSQAGKVAALVYGLDCIAIGIKTLGFDLISNFMPSLAKGIYTLWLFSRFNTLKRFLVFKSFGVSKSKDKEATLQARAKIVNNILEIVCYAACLSVLLDILQIKSGVTLKSLFAVSGAGTVVLSLASKDIASEIVSGLALQASDKVYEGEKVLFGNGLKGYVDRIGIFETLIRDSSEMVTAVPNKELHNQRLANISRNRYSQVKQKVSFLYEDLERLPPLLEEIKREIVRSCPFVISDASKPFRVYFYEYAECSLEVIVDVKMYITPDSTEYYQCREQVLLAIGRAVKNKDMQFAVMTEMLE